MSDWTAAEIELLRKEHAKGKTYGAIAKLLQRSRNSVIGWAGRHPVGVQAAARAQRAEALRIRRDRAAAAVRTKARAAAAGESSHADMRHSSPPKPCKAAVPADTDEPGGWPAWKEEQSMQERERLFGDAGAVPLIELGYCQCKWPVADAPKAVGGHLFCAAATEPARPYCRQHHDIAFVGIRGR
jgi:hypothetical protein